MKYRFLARGAVVALGVAGVVAPLAAQQDAAQGSIQFNVMASPTGGRPQPAPRLQVYLLSKSFSQIREEAEKEIPPPDMTAFIDSLEVSAELKEWMKKKKRTRLSGEEFVRQLSTNEVIDIPEFWEAYLLRNAPDVRVGFPKPKFKEANPDKNPEAYNAERKEYRERVRKHLTTYQHTKEGIDLHLIPLDPGQRWTRKEADRQSEVRQRAAQLAHTRYLVAKGETDLQGQGGFIRVTPGEFWLSTLEGEAIAGDVRLRWDVPVRVLPGATVQLELSNINAVLPARRP